MMVRPTAKPSTCDRRESVLQCFQSSRRFYGLTHLRGESDTLIPDRSES